MDNIKRRLEYLYPNDASWMYQTLEAMINDFRSRNPVGNRVGQSMFSEKDSVLITYADHVGEKGVSTLKTMGKFVKERLGGCINTIHFLPFFPYTSDDGFSVVDYYQIKEEFGGWDDVSAIGADFGLMFDFVVNHISQKSEWFVKYLAGDAEYKDYFISFDKQVDVSAVFRPRTHPLLTPFDTVMGRKYVWTTFSEDQIDVNIQNPKVFLCMIGILLFFVEKGARAIRLDAIGYLWKILGTSCFHLKQTHEVVKLMRDVLEQTAPYVWVITETNVPHKDNIAYFGSGSDEAHMVYNFTLPPLLLLTFLNQDSTYLTKWASGLTYPSDKTTFFNFTASHDGIGLQPLKGIVPDSEIKRLAHDVGSKGGKVNYRVSEGGGQEPYELNCVYLSAMGGNVDAFLASQAIQLSLRGVPGVYLNSLVGEENWTEGVEKLGYNRAINRRKFDYKELSGELDNTDSKRYEVYRRYAKMLKIRAGEPLFSPQAGQEVVNTHPKVFGVIRENHFEKMIIVVNVSREDITVDLSGHKLEKVRDLMKSGEDIDLKSVKLGVYQVRWLKRIS